MLAKLSSLARSGLIALSVVGGLTVTAVAGPVSPAPNPATDTAGNVIRIQGDGRYSDCTRGGDCWNGRQDRRWSRDHYRRDRDRGWRGRDRDRDWRDRDWRGRHWRSDRHWDNNRYWRRHRDRDRRHHRRHNDGPSFRIYLN